MRFLGLLFIWVGLAGLLISCTVGGVLPRTSSLPASFGLLIVGLLLRLAFPARRTDPDAPNPKTHVRCPDCRELVRFDASKCKHCGTALKPLSAKDMR